MSRLTLCILLIAMAAAAQTPAIRIGGERRLNFNDGWKFPRGELAGAEAPGFNDAQWRSLRLPHDWAIEGPFDPKLNPHEGALPDFGIAWYRKHFRLSGDVRGKRFSLELDGAMSNSRVFLNGKELGGRPYGYIGFAVDLTPGLNLDGENVVAVRLAPEERSS